MKRTLLIIALLLASLPILAAQAIDEQPASGTEKTRVFVDDLGREVSIPVDITRIAPSGVPAQVIVFQIAPEKLVGLASALGEAERMVYPEFTHDLPVYGSLYGKKASLNKETLILADPQLIIDVGDIKGSKEDMVRDLDQISGEVGVPVIFIEANMGNYSQVFRRLGALLGYEERAEQLATYYEGAVRDIEACRNGSSPRIYITSSNDGLYAIIAGKSHAECAEMAGAEVVVTSKLVQTNGNVSLETLYQLDPQYIFAYYPEGYRTITTSPEWASLEAVQKGRVYFVPNIPHGFIDEPACSNRIVGLYYLASIFYPEAGIDIAAKTKEFYSIFYRADLTDEQIATILHR